MKRKRLLASGILVILLAACSLPFERGGAALSISLQADGSLANPPPLKSARTILPDTGIIVSKWTIDGNGPSGRSFSLTDVEGTDHEIPALAPGVWTVGAKGYDATGALIVQSSLKTVTLTAAGSSSLTLTCGPITGAGTFGLSLMLPSGVAVNPAVSAILTPLGLANPTDTDLAPVLDTESGTWASSTDISAGWYVLRVRVTDKDAAAANDLLWSFVDTVRILKGRTSSFIRTLAAEDLAQPDNATLGLGLQPGLSSGISVSIAGHETGVTTAGGTVLTSSSTASGTLVWQWYLDGILVDGASGAAWTMPSSLLAGTRHWVTAVAYRVADANTLESAGSATVSFTVTE